MAEPVSPRRAALRVFAPVAARLGGAIFVLWAVASITFFAVRLIPGDPAQAVLGGPGSQASPEALAAVRTEYGFDKPVLVQYLAQLGRLATGDLGRSYALNQDVGPLVLDQLGGTVLLAVLALALAWLLALALAAWSTRGGTVAARVGSGLEIVAAALPHFWLATSLIVVFSIWLGVLPPISTVGAAGLVLPVLTLAIPLAGFLGQILRESLLAALESPFVLSARARGESERGVLWTHALRHASLPAISLSGWAFGSLISGAVVVETIFARPGLGRTLLTAVTLRDVPVVIGVVMIVAVAYILMTLLTDAATRLVDPRLRSE
ncbi:ABC transporter permease [Cryobacterium sp. TMT1-3]|uniref:ABC transporter permease n=1 Tax=Cryobacterium luteum TaxID=1424661 RepID=A0A5F0DFZ0_9MICO|nr:MULTISPECIES: ABC transporter permease [Cryobacterium]TFB95547.1 ABC transporter permease [Cryobacterium luteum]TFC31303.1 ABC transporter permease [Cryobacterium sp. TMT1-3]